MATRSSGLHAHRVLAALVIVGAGMLGVIQAVTQTARNGTTCRERPSRLDALNLITEAGLMARLRIVSESSDEVESRVSAALDP